MVTPVDAQIAALAARLARSRTRAWEDGSAEVDGGPLGRLSLDPDDGRWSYRAPGPKPRPRRPMPRPRPIPRAPLSSPPRTWST